MDAQRSQKANVGNLKMWPFADILNKHYNIYFITLTVGTLEGTEWLVEPLVAAGISRFPMVIIYRRDETMSDLWCRYLENIEERVHEGKLSVVVVACLSECKSMDTKLMQDELQLQKGKSPAKQSNSTKSFISALSRRRPIKVKSVSGSKAHTGYVVNNTECSNSDLGQNCNFKSSEKCDMKLTTDIARNKKIHVSGDIIKNNINNLRGERRNKHKEDNQLHKLRNFRVEGSVKVLKLKSRNKQHEKAIRAQKINTSKEENATNLKMKNRNKQCKGIVRIKEVKNTKRESNVKLEYRREKKSREEAMGIQKLNNSELTVPANMSPDAHNPKMGSMIKFKLKCRNEPYQEDTRIQKTSYFKKGDIDLKFKCRSKQQKGAIKIKKFNKSRINSNIKLEHRHRKKPKEEADRIQKLNYSELTISAHSSPVAVPKPSHTLLLDKVRVKLNLTV